MVNKVLYTLLFLIIAFPAWCATYNIGSDGDYATWDAFRDAVPSPTTGSDVYFKKGETHVMHSSRTHVRVDWTGTVGDRVIIGAYGSGADPIIDGQDTYPGPIPCPGSACWGSLVKLDGADYVTVQNLDVRNAEGYGLYAYDSQFFIFEDNSVKNTFRAGFMAHLSDDGLVDGNSFENISRRTLESTGGSPVEAGVTFMTSDRGIMEYNYITGTNGEGYGAYRGSEDCIIRYNLVEGVRVGIYIAHSQCDVLYNVVLNTVNNPTYSNCNGIVIGEEEYSWTTGILTDFDVAGNIVVGYTIGIRISMENDVGTIEDVRIYNNTLVGNDISVKLYNRYEQSFAGSYFKNNISWPLSTHAGVAWTPTMSWGPNHWSSVPIVVAVRHVNDVNSPPDFIEAGQWPNLSPLEFKISWAAYKDGSPGLGAGLDMSARITKLFAETDEDPRTATMSTVSTWDYGAVDYGTGTPPSTETICNDSVDNDDDGNIDCADSDCSSEEYCESPESTCDDGFDNDGDGYIDCFFGIEDSDCSCAEPPTGNQPLISGGVSF